MPYKKHLTSIKKLSLTSSGILISQALNLVFIPVLSRLYKPEDFAAFGFFLAVTVLLSGVASLKYQDAISTPFSTQTAASLIRISLLFAIVIIAIAAPILLIVYNILFSSYSLGACAIISASSVAIANIGMQILVRNKQYYLYTLIIFFLVGAGALLQVLFSSHEVNGLILGVTVSHALASLVAIYVIQKNTNNYLPTLTLRDKAAIRSFKTFPLFALPNFFLANLRVKLVYYILTNANNSMLMGYYAQSDRLLGAPTTLFTTALRPLATEAISKRAKSMAELLYSYLQMQWFTLLPILAIFLIYTQVFIETILGRDWVAATPIMQTLALPAFLMMTTSWLDRFYDFSKSHRSTLKIEIFFGVIATAVLIYFGRYKDQSMLAISWFSMTLTAYYLSWLLNLFLILQGSILRYVRLLLTGIFIFCSSFFVLQFIGNSYGFLLTLVCSIIASATIGVLIKRNE